MPVRTEYKGYTIYSEQDYDGHVDHWVQNGIRIVADVNSIEDGKELIDELDREMREVNAMQQEDTPALPQPWWETER